MNRPALMPWLRYPRRAKRLGFVEERCKGTDAVAADQALAATPRVDADFPGGNIVVEGRKGDTVFLHQDHRDSVNDRYWYFRVREAQGRTLIFQSTQGALFTARGPAVSLDVGRTWSWLGRRHSGAYFRYRVPSDTSEVRFAVGIPYVESDLRRFLARNKSDRHLVVSAICTTPRGRKAELIRAGRPRTTPRHRVLITCRHHACEAVTNYILEGILEAVSADDQTGLWFRQHVEIAAVPFVDKDGVEEGHQGKSRRPHDPNRDYSGESIYPTVAALRRWVPKWSGGRLHLALDLHCPYLTGRSDERIYFVETAHPSHMRELRHFSALLEEKQSGSTPYNARHNLRRGEGWNTDEYFFSVVRGDKSRTYRTFGAWARTLPRVRLAAVLEFPYATASGREVTQTSARAFGLDLARAMRGYLEGGTLGQ